MLHILTLILALAVSVWPLHGALQPAPVSAEDVANEAVAEALTLPPGYRRDTVLRAVSRNLRWFGQHEAGMRAAREMSDGGRAEAPPGSRPGPPRFIPLREAMPMGSSCDAGIWREQDGGEAMSAVGREAWARRCLLERDFHWVGLPDLALVRRVATALPPGETKAMILAMLVNSYGDPETLRFVVAEVERVRTQLPRSARARLDALLGAPVVLYRLGRTVEAVAAARAAGSFEPRAALIRLLVAANDIDPAITLFESLASTPPDFAETCFDWFGPTAGLGLSELGYAASPSPGIAAFLDRLPGSRTFRQVCPNGLDPELAVPHLLAAGRFDAAISSARSRRDMPFLLVDALLEVGETRLRAGDRVSAGRHGVAAADVLPAFNRSERSGDTGRRFRVIRLLAATGAIDRADRLARAQPPGALRAVALSAAAAGRIGIPFADQAPPLSAIDAGDLGQD